MLNSVLIRALIVRLLLLKRKKESVELNSACVKHHADATFTAKKCFLSWPHTATLMC